ncbi:hypothetical protein GGR53DRAFT_465610 [Hypoxylon sp. FL1150]|nr:hypothetical protein GGR53DRAFT_465610 [Hypoxylon sp. FL1150]
MSYTPSVVARDRHAEPTSAPLLNHIKIYHPSYPATAMVVLPTSDNGVHYTVAYYTCCIIADNVWKEDEARTSGSEGPFLATSANPADRITIPGDDILRDRVYYFHVPDYPDPDEPYPIVPNFEHWPFPHDNVPKPWLDVSVSEEENSRRNHSCVRDTDVLNDPCHLTGTSSSLNACHVVPKAHRYWFGANRMEEYLGFYTAKIAINACSNLISFRADVHKSMDDKMMVMVPKPVGQAPDRYKLLIHVLQPPPYSVRGYLELCDVYHNHEVVRLVGIHHAFLFSRFAYSIFNDFTFPLCKNLKGLILMAVQGAEGKVHKWERGSKIPKFEVGQPDASKARKRNQSEMSRGNHTGQRAAGQPNESQPNEGQLAEDNVDGERDYEDSECDLWEFTTRAVGYDLDRDTDSDESDTDSLRCNKRSRSDLWSGSDDDTPSDDDEPESDLDDEDFYRLKGIPLGKGKEGSHIGGQENTDIIPDIGLATLPLVF